MSALQSVPEDDNSTLGGRRTPVFYTGLFLSCLLIIVAIVAPVILGAYANGLTSDSWIVSSRSHLLGTDEFGRDLLARALVGTRLTLLLALSATFISVAVGSAIGLIVWIMPNYVRNVVLGINSALVALPSLVMALVIAAVLGPGAVSATVAVGVASIPAFIRLVSNMAQAIMAKEFIGAAKLLGVGNVRLLLRHVLPNIAAPLLVLGGNTFAVTLTELSGLSFIGLGVQNPSYDFGKLLSDALPNVYTAPLQVVGPSFMIVLAATAGMLLSDGLGGVRRLEDRLSPSMFEGRLISRRQPLPARQTIPKKGTVLDVRDLRIVSRDGRELVNGVSLSVGAGEIVGLVGESGSGKSLTAMACADLVPAGVAAEANVATVDDVNLLEGYLKQALALTLSVIYQDPMSSFNPVMRIGSQLTETVRMHARMPKHDTYIELVDRLDELDIGRPRDVAAQYPYELSGGMLQRAMIASALLSKSKLIIADEPTTALDVTVQLQVVQAITAAVDDIGSGVLFISHDLALVREMCDRIYVMYQGEIVEELTPDQMNLDDVKHPYTRRLLVASGIVDKEKRGHQL